MATEMKPSHDKVQQPRRILVVEDQRNLAELLVYNLQRAGFEATAVHDGQSALKQIENTPPDLLLLDVMLPELSGTEVAARVRSNPATAHLPIIMLTARTEEVDQLVGLTVGADDYITKPFSTQVLVARIEALLRRTRMPIATATPQNSLQLGAVVLNLDTHQATAAGVLVRLTLTEFRLLEALLAVKGRVLSRSHLITKAMGPGITVTERTVDVHMTAIRKKLGEHGSIIHTVRGVGYRASEEPEVTNV